MNESTLIFFAMKAQTYEKFKSLKNNEMFKSLDENDFLMHIFNKVSEDINLTSPLKNHEPNILQIYNATQSNKIPSIVTVKAEKQYPTESTATIESNSDIIPYECNDCRIVFHSDIELQNHIYINHTNKNGQYICTCGEHFYNFKLFLQHNFNCKSIKLQIKDEPNYGTKRLLSDTSIDRVKIKHENVLNFTENNCKDCHRKFRTSSSLYLHQCKKKMKLQSSSETSGMKIQDEEISFYSNLYENNKAPLKEARPVLICRCLMEFFDHKEFFKHSETCGKPNNLDNSQSSYSNKSSPLKVLPNVEGKYECADCPKSFTSILSLRQHRDGLHRDTPKFVCKNCGKGYRWCTSFHYHKVKCINKS